MPLMDDVCGSVAGNCPPVAPNGTLGNPTPTPCCVQFFRPLTVFRAQAIRFRTRMATNGDARRYPTRSSARKRQAEDNLEPGGRRKQPARSAKLATNRVRESCAVIQEIRDTQEPKPEAHKMPREQRQRRSRQLLILSDSDESAGQENPVNEVTTDPPNSNSHPDLVSDSEEEGGGDDDKDGDFDAGSEPSDDEEDDDDMNEFVDDEAEEDNRDERLIGDSEGDVDSDEEQNGRNGYTLLERNRRRDAPNNGDPGPRRKMIKFSHSSSRQNQKLKAIFGDDDSVPDVDVYQAFEGPSLAEQMAQQDSRCTSQNRPANLAGGDSSRSRITPVHVDPSLTFQDVGGLDSYISALKEIVFLPLVYPELFRQLHLSPPRGVLFYGPPGTGKTLMARALAATASRAGKQVSFFMRKGADVLSKWVGESEKELRLLFEEAKRQEPSIIFFDEIDGLAPARSSKSDQVHNSIVATLLALMDGLDDRGQVVVIGATNNVDSLDPALRRPGRFDRELMFPLPNLDARKKIINIHTRQWVEPPTQMLQQELAEVCVGYCGADIKALCTEASLNAVRRTFPQIYKSDQRLLLDPKRVKVTRDDFLKARQMVTPSAHRSAAQYARGLTPPEGSVLGRHVANALDLISRTFPAARICLEFNRGGKEIGDKNAAGSSSEFRFQVQSTSNQQAPNPCCLICGKKGYGTDIIGRSVLHQLDGLPVFGIGFTDLFSDGGRSPEEVLISKFREASRASPSIIYLPEIEVFWESSGGLLKTLLKSLWSQLPGNVPVFLLATSNLNTDKLDKEIVELVGGDLEERVYCVSKPKRSERKRLFEAVMQRAIAQPVVEDQPSSSTLELSPDFDAVGDVWKRAEKLKHDKLVEQYHEEQALFRDLRMHLRKVVLKLIFDDRWSDFHEPVALEDGEYWARVREPMDLSTILCRVNNGQYLTTVAFLQNVKKIAKAMEDFYGDDPIGREDITCAHCLHDEAAKLVDEVVPKEMAAKCELVRSQGGPLPPPEGVMLEDVPLEESDMEKVTKGNSATAKRASARLRGEQVDEGLFHANPEETLRKQRSTNRPQQNAESNVDTVVDNGPVGALDSSTSGTQDEQMKESESDTGPVRQEDGHLQGHAKKMLKSILDLTKGFTFEKLLVMHSKVSRIAEGTCTDRNEVLTEMKAAVGIQDKQMEEDGMDE